MWRWCLDRYVDRKELVEKEGVGVVSAFIFPGHVRCTQRVSLRNFLRSFKYNLNSRSIWFSTTSCSSICDEQRNCDFNKSHSVAWKLPIPRRVTSIALSLTTTLTQLLELQPTTLIHRRRTKQLQLQCLQVWCFAIQFRWCRRDQF